MQAAAETDIAFTETEKQPRDSAACFHTTPHRDILYANAAAYDAATILISTVYIVFTVSPQTRFPDPQ